MFRIFLMFLLTIVSAAVLAYQVELSGNLEEGGLVIGQAPPGSSVSHDGHELRVAPDGRFLLGFHRDAEPQSELVVTFPDGSVQKKALEVAQRDYKIQRIDGLPPRKVNPKESDLKRIRADIAAVKKARQLDDARTDFTSGWQWPVIGRISGVYGSQRILNGEPKRPHYGIDIAAPAGTDVVAPADGVVTLAHPDMFYSGATLLLDHGHGLSSGFLHLQKILVEEGEAVKRGQVIARVGSSGRSTGAHLDWRINLFDKRLDPGRLAGPMPKK